MPAERQTLILVVGMHRSGTSLLGSILPALGVATPGPLIAGDQHNPEGYYEREDVTALQEQLLINLKRWWPSQEGVLPLPATWMEQPAGQACAAGLMRLLGQEKARQTGAWAIKDPRSSLLLPLWQRLAESLGLDLRIVLSLRDPREVQRSLVQRDRSSTGMTGWRAQQLWWRHNSQAVFDSLQADLPLLVLHYSRWFNAKQADRQLQRLAQFCLGRDASPSALERARRCIRPEHRRSNAGPQWLHPKLAQLERKLQRLPGNRRRVQRWLAAQPQTLCLPLGRLRGRLPSPPLGLQLSNDPTPNCSGLIQLVGSDWRSWQAHAWLQHVPVASPSRHLQLIDGSWPRWGRRPAVLHLQPVSRNRKLLAQLRHCPVVYDPDPDRCRQLRALGVNAYWLRSARAAANDWLETLDPAAASHELGLPPIHALGQSPLPVLCLGSGGDRFEQQLEPPCWCLPGFDQIQIHSPAQARLLASWLNQAQGSGLQLVRLQPTQQDHQEQGLRALCPPVEPDRQWLPPQLFSGQIGLKELLAELRWRANGYLSPEPCLTPTPEHELLWDHSNGTEATAAICVSLYNYADQIQAALESALQQSHRALELIVVDDASTDAGAELVQRWMSQHGARFVRCRLLRHTHNGGLAAARNTAFADAQAPWCFVLDADNSLHHEAVAQCLAVAEACDPQVAVVHPLVALRYCSPDPQPRSLISRVSWQREHFRNGNVVDAMALVRRRAWKQVGGYLHIPGGWEDFDFWCLLMEAGFTGVLCPQRLATYTVHANSMVATGTSEQERKLSRLLEQRHPWLQLPKARLTQDA